MTRQWRLFQRLWRQNLDAHPTARCQTHGGAVEAVVQDDRPLAFKLLFKHGPHDCERAGDVASQSESSLGFGPAHTPLLTINTVCCNVANNKLALPGSGQSGFTFSSIPPSFPPLELLSAFETCCLRRATSPWTTGKCFVFLWLVPI